MTQVFLGLGTNIDRNRSMRAGLDALSILAPELIVSQMYESEAVGFEGAPFYNCVVQLRTEMTLGALVSQLKAIEDTNGRNRTAQAGEGKGLDIDVLTYGDLVGEFEGMALPRSDITRYAHVLMPLAEIAPDVILPGATTSFQMLWRNLDQGGQSISIVADFESGEEHSLHRI